MVNKCACVLGRPEDMEDEDISTSFYIYLRSTSQLCIQRFDHFRVVAEIYKIKIVKT